MNSPVGWSCRIHWLHLCIGVRLPPTLTVNKYPRYDIKPSDGDPSALESW